MVVFTPSIRNWRNRESRSPVINRWGSSSGVFISRPKNYQQGSAQFYKNCPSGEWRSTTIRRLISMQQGLENWSPWRESSWRNFLESRLKVAQKNDCHHLGPLRFSRIVLSSRTTWRSFGRPSFSLIRISVSISITGQGRPKSSMIVE